MKTKIVHLHASGRFDVSGGQMTKRLHYLADLGANVITLTEVDFVGAEIIQFAGKKWGVWHPSGDGKRENAVLWLKSEFTAVQKGCDKITDLHLKVGRTAPLYATTVVLRTNSGEEFLVTTTHLPAHLDAAAVLNENTKTNNWPSRVHLSASWGWHRSLKQYKTKRKIVAADWNLDFKRPQVVAYAKLRFPRLKSGYNFNAMSTNLKGFGTHGRRFIDASLSNLKRVSASVVHATTPGFDHRVVKTVYEI